MSGLEGDAALLGHVEAFLFDFDGTLVTPTIDFGLLHERVIEVVEGYGVSDPTLEPLPVLEIVAGARGRMSEAQGLCFQQAADEAILQVELEAAARAVPYEGVPAMLHLLTAQGYGVGVVTRNCRAAVEIILEEHPLAFDIMLTRDDVQHVKPDPRHLAVALDHMAVLGQNTAMVGDHPMDLEAGHGVGAVTVGILTDGYGPERFAPANPDLVLTSTVDLLQYIRPCKER